MKAKPKNIVASVLARLRSEANAESAPFNQVLQFYAIERFLYRLSKSKHVDGVLLKGALLLKTVGIPRARPTMDINFLRQGKADRATLIAIVRDCASMKDESDGIEFDPESVSLKRSLKTRSTREHVCASRRAWTTCASASRSISESATP